LFILNYYTLFDSSTQFALGPNSCTDNNGVVQQISGFINPGVPAYFVTVNSTFQQSLGVILNLIGQPPFNIHFQCPYVIASVATANVSCYMCPWYSANQF